MLKAIPAERNMKGVYGRSLLPIMPLLRRQKQAPCTTIRYISEPKTSMKDIRGRSMIEMLGVLAIIGVLSAGGIMGYNLAMEEHKINKFAADMSTIAANAINVFGNSKNMGGIIRSAALCQTKILPEEYCKTFDSTTNRFKNPWGSNLDIAVPPNPMGSPEKLYIWTGMQPAYKNGIPQKACVKLATMKWTGFKKVHIGIHYNSSTRTGLYPPVSTTLAKQRCYDTKGNENQIVLEFYF